MEGLTRREVLVAAAIAGGGLVLQFRPASLARAAGPDVFAPNPFIRIGSDGLVTIVVAQVEMGQGVDTSMSMLVAEELEVGLDQVRVEHAPHDDKGYGLPGYGFQVTGASSSVRACYLQLRQAGAAARTMLITAAANAWKVDASTCRAERGTVSHPPTHRKLGYGELADRAAKLAVPAQVALKDPKDWKLIGTPAKRVDTPAKVNGTAQFGIDVKLPGMKIATVAASPVVGGKLVGVDDAKARAVKGVRQIVQLDDVVAVVADDMWAAKQGLRALAIRWDDGLNAGVASEDVARGLAVAAKQPGVVVRSAGDTAAALAKAPARLEATFELPFLAHAPMEPMNCTVHVRRDFCEVWTGSQVLTRAQAAVAQVTGLPLDKVTVHNYLIGGAFGRRLEVDYVIQAVRIGQKVEGPVKVIWTREEDIQHDIYRPSYHDHLVGAVDARGRLLAWTQKIVGPSILARWAPPVFKDGVDPDAVDGAAQLVYDIPAIRIEYVRHKEAAVRTGFWRAVGVNNNCFATESFIDELATAANQDPVSYRRALLGKSPRARAVLDLAAQAGGWGRPLPAGRGRGVSLMYSDWDSYLAAVAEVSVSATGDIRLHRIVCAVDCGVVINPDTVKAQIEGGIIFGASAALYSEVTVKGGRVQESNFHDFRVLRINEAPAIDVHLVPSRQKPGGIGEPGTAVTAPAIANAVFAATGKRIRKLPLAKQLGAI